MSLTAALLQFYSPSSPSALLLLPTNTTATAADRLAYQNGHRGGKKYNKKKAQSFWLDWPHSDQFDVVVIVTQHTPFFQMWWGHSDGTWLMMTPSLIQMMVMRLLLSASVHKHRLQEDGGQKSEEGREKRGVSPRRDEL